jgi:Ni/Co efflux regulator RcnB
MAKASKIKIGFGDDLGRVIEGINIDMHEEGRDNVIKEFTDLLRGWGYVFPRMGLRSAQTAEASAQVSIQGNIPTVGDRVDEIRRWFKAHNAGTPQKYDARGKIKAFDRWTNQEVTDYYFGMSMRYDDFGIKGLMTPTEAVNWYKGQSLTLAGNVTAEVNGGVQNLVRIGLEEGHSINRITQNIKNFAGNFSNWRSANIARTESAKALNQGRHEVFGIGEKTGFITGYEYMGIMDERITPLCEELTRRSPFELSANNRGYLKTIQPPNHFACRSIMSPVLARESQPRWRKPVALKPLGSGGKTYPGFWTIDIGHKVKGKTPPTKVTPPQPSKPK